MKYKHNKTGEEVAVERWVWGVLYKDDTELHQYDEDGIFHQIGEVDQDKVDLFVLYKPDTDQRIDIVIPKGARLIHKYRNFVFDANTKNERQVKIYILGYKYKGNYHYNYILPDDRIVQSIEDNVKLTKFNI